MGRRKIQIEKISNKNYLQATFSKRRNGLFKKAREFCRLTGAEIAVIVFSPGGRPFPFGLPSADSVIDRYDPRTEDNSNEEGTREFPYTIDDEEEDDAHDDDMSSEQSNEAADGNDELGEARFWWDGLRIEDMELNQLEQFKSSLEVLRNELAYKLHDNKRRESHTKDYLSLIDSRTSTEDMELKQLESCSEVSRYEQLAYEFYETKRRESETKDFLSLIGSSSSTGSNSSTFNQIREAQLRYIS